MSLSEIINSLSIQAYSEKHSGRHFVPGSTYIPVTGKVFDNLEIEAAINASTDFWLTSGPETEKFESKLSKFIGVRHSFMVNSGSSANLLALTSLTSKKLGAKALKPGDEVITVAAGFPTTVTPILQNGLTPVYVDIDLGTYVANSDALQEAIGPKTRAIMMAHTLGNPFDLELVKKICDENEFWLIEDGCDALGGTYNQQLLGSFGHLSTLSFYPAHHITTGEGGAVLTRRADLKPIIESFRDWGRDCWCAPGCDNTCFKRFDWELGELPNGYDHKYTYSHLGYNLKSGDIQAAIGNIQMEKLPNFIQSRKMNWKYLHEKLSDLSEFLILPEATYNSDPSWFGFCLTVRKDSPVTRNELVRSLEENQIGTRLLFGGNLLKQPAFIGTPQRVIGSMNNSNEVMKNSFWLGVWPGLSREMLDYVSERVHQIFGN
jgi:CDP-6-deoxy-D-xylo-4-hexulose-3-dehydrase